MKKSFNRREFLKSSIQGLGTLALFSSPIKLLAGQSSSSSNSASPAIDPNILYKQAKEYFRKKEYVSSIEIYKQLILNYPARIAYYDGYARVLGAQQNSLGIAELYRTGLQKNAASPHFKHRLSLSLRNLCTGNHKAELAFINKYGQENLMTFSAVLLMEAIALKPIKGYMMDLRDFPVILENKNKALNSSYKPLIHIETSLIDNIKSVTSSVDDKWLSTRKSRKPVIVNADAEVDDIKNKDRHDLYLEIDKNSRKKETKKAIKERWKDGLMRNIKSNNIYLVEKYGSLILTDSINDTDTIGKLRKYYLKQKAYDRIVNLNRNLYINNNNFINSLALANSLVKYANTPLALSEARQLLINVKPYVNTLPAVNTVSYYQILAQINIKEIKPVEARDVLMQGLKLYDGRGGLSYSLMENYAMTYLNSETEKGIAIMKALCNKEQKNIDESVLRYIKNYLASNIEKKLSNPEQLKSLMALAKLQKKAGDAGYAATLSEINTLKSTLN